MSQATSKVALITGASSGIGHIAAARLAKEGFQVFGTSRRASSNAPAGAEMLVCDVTDPASVEKLVADVLARTGRIDVVVNNAGLALLAGAEESSIAQAQALFDVNFFGAVRVVNAVLPHMRARKSGRIINISSVLGIAPAPYSALYSATKHAIEGYSESLDHEVREFNIRVSTIEPAYTATDIESNAMEPDKKLPEYEAVRQRLSVLFKEFVAAGDDPSVVADAIMKAATDATPKRRYPAGKQAKQISFIRRFGPGKLFEKVLRKEMGLAG